MARISAQSKKTVGPQGLHFPEKNIKKGKLSITYYKIRYQKDIKTHKVVVQKFAQ